MGRLGRRHCARTRRLFPRALGWFGQGARVLLAGIVALALIASGELTQRRELKSGIAGLPKAYIPSVLTAAGTAIAYADIYAAYALYGFIGPAAAFVILGIVALGTTLVQPDGTLRRAGPRTCLCHFSGGEVLSRAQSDLRLGLRRRAIHLF